MEWRGNATVDSQDSDPDRYHAVTELRLPGIIATVRGRHGTWSGTAGVADTRAGRKRQAQERFRIGSITKTFTATVVLQLVAEGELSLDDTVETWLPGLLRGDGYDGRLITIKQLLNMTSGLFNYALDKEMLRRFYTPAFLKHRFDAYRCPSPPTRSPRPTT
ncbi:serine hydrolase domain-containing protein [Nonomuraea typhae]|uniref:serine hydrolase domain-containing protein n=1 Tax=Nonomuraea typhae TaxID=2603600 RepID=UPI0012FAE4DD|nr:serine hydrolase domain-containing protein [Nonomuraea typhae]